MFCQIFPTCNQTSFQNSKENKMKHPDSPSDDLDLVKDLPLMIDDEKTETEVSGDEMKPASSPKSKRKSETKKSSMEIKLAEIITEVKKKIASEVKSNIVLCALCIGLWAIIIIDTATLLKSVMK